MLHYFFLRLFYTTKHNPRRLRGQLRWMQGAGHEALGPGPRDPMGGGGLAVNPRREQKTLEGESSGSMASVTGLRPHLCRAHEF
jgi:hypothetical protein